MKYDVFFSISQTPVDGYMPDEPTMLRDFFSRLLADRLGYGTAWIAQAHLSTEIRSATRSLWYRIFKEKSVSVQTSFSWRTKSLLVRRYRSGFRRDEFDVQWWSDWDG